MTASTHQDLPFAHTGRTDQPAAGAPCERRMLSKQQVAARLGCSERSLERLVKQGRFPASRRYGRAVVWFESAVERVLALAEQEQLQWQASASPPADVSVTPPHQLAQPAAPCAIPAAHELERAAPPDNVRKPRKPRKAASDAKRRVRTGASDADIAALKQVFWLPTV